MPVGKPKYALVAYVRNATGRFVESMRRELHPDHSHLPAHITILPPRYLSGTEQQALSMLRAEIPKLDAFSVRLGDVPWSNATRWQGTVRARYGSHQLNPVDLRRIRLCAAS